MNRADNAVACFSNGCNCSQAVFTAFCEDLGIDKKTGLKIACSFGGGMGHIGEACGAVTGALLVLGLKYGHSKELNYLLVKDFTSRFQKRNGSIHCTDLIGYDLSLDDQLNTARQTDAFKTKCSNYVSDAVNLLEEIISEYQDECEDDGTSVR